MSRAISLVLRKYGIWSLLLVAAAAWAGTAYSDFLRALAQRESSMNQYAVNQYGYMGLFQMGSLALQDAGFKNASGGWTGKDGVRSQSDFLANAQAQINAVTAYQQKAEAFILSKKLDAAIGTTINGVPITASGLIAGYHLVGPTALTNFIRYGIVTADGNKVPITAYIKQFGGYALPVAGTTVAALLAATPTGGTATSGTSGTLVPTTAPLVTAPPLLPGISAAAPSYANAAEGFHGATGYQMGEVRAVFVLLTAALVLLWFARTFVSTWAGFTDGKLTLPHIGNNAVQGAIVVLILMYLLV